MINICTYEIYCVRRERERNLDMVSYLPAASLTNLAATASENRQALSSPLDRALWILLGNIVVMTTFLPFDY